MRNIKLTTITLKNREFKEKDKIITVLSREFGKYDLLAKGVQKPLTKISGISEPFSYGNIIVSQLKNLGTITSCDLKESFSDIRINLNTISHTIYLLELTDKCTAYENSSEELFDTLLAALYMFENKTNPETVTRFFEHKIIDILGYGINIKTCLGCGSKLTGSLYYNVDFGGFFCENCKKLINNAIIFPNALLSYINVLDSYSIQTIKTLSFPPQANEDLSKLYKNHLAYRIDKNINSLDFIKSQKILKE